jgi:hypothetical protein
MSNKFPTKTRVAVKSTETPFLRGVVVGEASVFDPRVGETIIVEFDNGHVSKTAVKALLLEAEASVQERLVDDEKSRLERDYETARANIAVKIREAAAALTQATKLAELAGSELQDFYEEVRPLMRAMDEAGWSSSSLSC